MDTPYLLLVEGLDLAGKTSACVTLRDSLAPRPQHYRNALSGGNALYTVTDELRRMDSLDGTYLGHAYLAAAALDTARFSAPDLLRIQESTIALRSLAHYRARGEIGLANGFSNLLDDPAYPRFDRAVVLTASFEARRERLEMRRRQAPEEVAPDDLVVLNAPDVFRRMEEVLIEEAFRRYDAVILDTTMLTKNEVVDAIRAQVQDVIL